MIDNFQSSLPKSNSVIVSHQWTDPVKLWLPPLNRRTSLALMTPRNGQHVGFGRPRYPEGEFNSTLFPSAPAGLEIHSGFRDEHALITDEIRTEVQRLIEPK